MKINKLLWLPACLVAGTVFAGGQKVVELKIEVKPAHAKVWAEIELNNRSGKPVKVLHALATEEEMYGKLFDVRDAGGQPVEYRGIMVKRGPLTEEDFLTLKPGERRKNRIELSRAYTFQPGQQYTLAYSGIYKQDGKTMPLTAAPVRFEHTGR